MGLNVIHRTELAHAQKVGLVYTVEREFVTITNMVKIVIPHASVIRTQQRAAIHGLVNVIARQDGAVVCAIDHVRS